MSDSSDLILAVIFAGVVVAAVLMFVVIMQPKAAGVMIALIVVVGAAGFVVMSTVPSLHQKLSKSLNRLRGKHKAAVSSVPTQVVKTQIPRRDSQDGEQIPDDGPVELAVIQESGPEAEEEITSPAGSEDETMNEETVEENSVNSFTQTYQDEIRQKEITQQLASRFAINPNPKYGGKLENFAKFMNPGLMQKPDHYINDQAFEYLESMSTSLSPYHKKVLLFVHISKCAGTSITHLLRKHKNEFKSDDGHFYNKNGNPWSTTPHDHIIRFTSFDEARLNQFVNLCHSIGAEFVNAEFEQLQDIKLLRKFDAVVCLREPLSRYLSQRRFYPNKVSEKQASNMMVRTLCNQYWTVDTPYNSCIKCPTGYLSLKSYTASDEEQDAMLMRAKRLLDEMDVIILEKPETFRVLEKFSVDVTKLPHENKTKICSDETVDVARFKQENRLDYELYAYACQLATERGPNGLRKILHRARPSLW